MEKVLTKKLTVEEAKKKKTDEINNWTNNKIEICEPWIEDQQKVQSILLKRGGIYDCELGENIGSEMCGKHPVLVVSRDILAQTSGDVLVIPLSTKFKTKKNKKNKTIAKYANHMILWKSEFPFLRENSAVKAELLRCVSKSRIGTYWGDLTPKQVEMVLTRLDFACGR
ncbi:hypothetical protein IEC_05831 [Bacillus toyonensis]|uniref:type II toxin-antitoxin system PemK/MazF family toxin n=1 Tax=Bacillus toyonensis TaxID=155322 RepID=UPI000278EFAE|nr:type II toxin-antitoxin system PemK/MazF family toxin [Bacillus toyonensis]EJQ29001.1 hypothetical protein IEC_05831 [Bacillus toyonensis]